MVMTEDYTGKLNDHWFETAGDNGHYTSSPLLSQPAAAAASTHTDPSPLFKDRCVGQIFQQFPAVPRSSTLAFVPHVILFGN